MASIVEKDELLEVLPNFRCHLTREDGKSIKEFLNEELKKYVSELKQACEGCNSKLGKRNVELIRGKISNIEENAGKIIKVFSLHENGKVFEATELAFSIFDDMRDYMPVGFDITKNRYFRIRSWENDPVNDREGLFHIPLSKRHLVKTERYSIPGHPCLYLATQAPLCWYECGKPLKFSIARFDVPQDVDDNFKLIDFQQKLMPLKLAFITWLDNANGENEKDQIGDYLLKVLYTLPLRMACSVDVLHPMASFKEEYILPQLLTQWISKEDCFDGVKYESCKNDDEVHIQGGYNVVFVTKQFDKDGYDIELRKRISVGEPKNFELTTDEVNPWHIGIDDIPEEFQRI